MTHSVITQNWGLWSHDSWRAVAAHGTVLITAVFVVFCAKTLESEATVIIDRNTTVLTHGSSTLATGAVTLVAGYALFSYSNYQKNNQLRKDNLSILMSIGALADTLLKKYNLEPEQHTQLDKLNTTIKRSARNCVSIRTIGLELTEQLQEVHQLMNELYLRLNTFIDNLPESLEELQPEFLKHELLFWTKDPLEIKEELLSEPLSKSLEV